LSEVNAPFRLAPLVRPVLTLVVACAGLLLIPAIASVSAVRPPPGTASRVRLQEAATGRCEGKSCSELVEMEVRDVVPLEESSHAVVLVTKDRETVLPIFVDEAAALAIAFRMAHKSSPEQQPQDLMDSMLTQLGGELTEVRIDTVEESMVSGRVMVTQGEKHLQLPARPSDSIALALAHGVKIFATRQVLADAGISQADIERLKKRLPPGHRLPGHPRKDEELGQGGSGDDDGEVSEELPRGKNAPIRL
jgi:hypothetical protein